MNSNNSYLKNRNKIIYLLFIVFIFFIILLSSIYRVISNDRKIPPSTISKSIISVRGSIYTNNSTDSIEYGFKVAKSIQVFKAVVDTRFIDKNKIDLFITLFSLYSNIDRDKVQKKFNSQKRLGKLVLSYNIDSKSASYLRQLKYKLNRLKVFVALKKNSSHIIGMDIIISGDKRVYKYEDTLTPIIGFTKKFEDKHITRIKGVKGLEKYYDKELNNYQNALYYGERDIIGDILFNKSSIVKNRVDGKSLKLNIDLKLQKSLELLSTKYKEKFQAKEIFISIMDSRTGKVLSLVTSNRFNPKKIKQDEIGYLDIKAIESAYEYGSVIKPIAMALVFDKDKVKLKELIDAFNKGKRNKKGLYPRGKYKIGRFKIGDDHRFKKRYITATDTIVYSSNIGILQLAQRLTGVEFRDGFKKFGLSEKTGIDLPYEKRGVIHSLKQYQAYESKGKDNIYKATDSYGQGITSTFIQVLKAYSVFNNNGYTVTPQIVSSIIDTSNGKVKNIKVKEPIKIIKQKTAMIIKDMLIKTVNIGTGVATKIDGLEIGGKTGTSQIARKGKYQREYISSFFGFANDENYKYTIGVTVFEPSYKYHYASQSATPVFKKTIDVLVKQGYLTKSNNLLN